MSVLIDQDLSRLLGDLEKSQDFFTALEDTIPPADVDVVKVRCAIADAIRAVSEMRHGLVVWRTFKNNRKAAP